MVQISLKAARVNLGLKQGTAAERVGVSSATLSKYEKDSSNIPYSLLRSLSEAYGIPIDNIFLGKKYELNRTNDKEV
jgi:transcriptional regulator with XRE-family HTH domain